MARRPVSALPRLRGRLWRLAALWLWVAVFVVNLAAAFDHSAAAGSLAADQQASLCHSGDGSTSAPVDVGGGQGTDPHCALCHIFAAGVLATPTDAPTAVLRPARDGLPVWAAATAAPQTVPPFTQAQPRAPPVSV